MLFYQGESGDITAVIRNKETQEVIPASTLNISVLKALLMDQIDVHPVRDYLLIMILL
jgi:hypothetical protein